jgi:hypothetical protein
MSKKSFRSFLEEEEKQSYLSSLEDVLGIDPKDMKNEPQIGTFFSFGPKKTGLTSNIGPYTIKSFKRNKDGEITHAVVVKVNDPLIKSSEYKDEDGEMVRVGKEKENKTFLVDIKDLEGLLSQDLEPMPAQGGVV